MKGFKQTSVFEHDSGELDTTALKHPLEFELEKEGKEGDNSETKREMQESHKMAIFSICAQYICLHF